MSIEIRKVESRKELRQFIHLPAAIHSGEKNFLPPIYADDWNFFDSKKNVSFASCDTILVLAWHNGKPVGRVMGIIHNKYNQLHNEKNARFGYLDCYNDREISDALIGFIENWALDHGMEKVIGPYGFSDKDVQGLLVEGFEHMPILDSACNPPYIVELLKQKGYTKEVDCMIYRFPLTDELPQLYYRIIQRSNHRNEYQILEFATKKQLKPYIFPVLKLVNETYDELFGFVPMTDEDIQEFVDRYMSIIDPRFVKIAVKEGVIIGFIVGLPNFTRGIQQSKGYLFPVGIFQILWAQKHTRQLDLMLGAVKREFQGLGLEVAMGLSIVESARKAGMEFIEVHLILETNRRMQAEMERLNLPVHKRFRVFQKSLPSK
ncbi:MAG TPA: hypothetical protein PLJ84_09540 [Bacteroidales bacterium]|nr:hypothetical protein [Bacteroidales bacterium]HPT02828.1 hypothetical protein [Bacteroidales bacterium]